MIHMLAGVEPEYLEEGMWNVPWFAGITNTYDGLMKAWDMIQAEARGDVKVNIVNHFNIADDFI